MIRIEQLHKTLGGVPVLRGVDQTIEEGEVLALVGSSGTGKSVLLKHIMGLLEPDAGDVLIRGRSVARASYRELAELRRGVGYVFQDAALLDSLTIRENLRLALDDAAVRRRPGFAEQRIEETLEAVNLDTRVLECRPGELSGGMRKRAGVARAIINQPSVILYDEPTTGLDPRNVAIINRLVLSNRERLGATSVVITHDIPSLPLLADRVALLDGGRIRFLGTAAEFFAATDPLVTTFTGRSQTGDVTEEEPWLATLAAATR